MSKKQSLSIASTHSASLASSVKPDDIYKPKMHDYTKMVDDKKEFDYIESNIEKSKVPLR